VQDTRRMPTLLGLAFAAAAYPQLLAIVIVILTRPEPRRLLWACYFGALAVSGGCALAILLVFRDRAGVLGSSSHRLGAAPFLIVGVIGVILAVLIAGERTRDTLGRRLPRRRTPAESPDGRRGKVDRLKASASGALARGSVGVALGVGAILGVPGPFDVLALGRIVRTAYALAPSLVMIVIFNLIKFALIEVPIISYALDPSGTAARVDRFATWMKANQIRVIALVIGIIGLLLIGRGITRL
jgi:Sap, sulfolipid-1-addressing protein